jgi:hypothetical protein
LEYAGWLSDKAKTGADAAPPSQSPVAAPPQPVVRTLTAKIIDGNIELAPTQIKWVTFSVPEGALKAVVIGQFHAFGGTGNDVDVVIASADEFENWKNGHQAMTFYSSGKTTNGKIMASGLSPGNQYILGFSNKFSIASRKQVEVKAVLGYQVSY